MKARKLVLRGTLGDEEYLALEIFGKEFTGRNGMPVSITLKSTAREYEDTEEIEGILDLIVERINKN